MVYCHMSNLLLWHIYPTILERDCVSAKLLKGFLPAEGLLTPWELKEKSMGKSSHEPEAMKTRE